MPGVADSAPAWFKDSLTSGLLAEEAASGSAPPIQGLADVTLTPAWQVSQLACGSSCAL